MPVPATSSPASLRLGIAVAAVAACLLAGLASAQDSEQTFFESIDVNVVNVEVYVTERKGRRPGFTQDDFQVLEAASGGEQLYAVPAGQVSQQLLRRRCRSRKLAARHRSRRRSSRG